MANFNVNLSVQFGSLSAFPSSVTAEAGDTITFIYNMNDGGFDPITITPPPSLFTNTQSFILMTVGDSHTRTVSTQATGTYSFQGNTTPSFGFFDDLQVTITQTTDDTPDQFTLNNVTNASLSTTITSNTITVSGINVPITASVSGSSATFRVNNGSYTTANKTVNNGDTINVRMVSAGTYSTARSTTLNLNGVTDTWTVTTRAANTTPDPFSFTNLTNVSPSQQHISNQITVSGIEAGITASISGGGGQFSVNGGAFSSTSRTVNNGDVIDLRMTSSANYSTTVTTTLNLNGVTGSWSITTQPAQSETLIFPFPRTSLPVSISDLKNFWGIGHAAGEAYARLTNYYRGGDLVPNITQNNAIPTSGAIFLSDFVGASHQAYWVDNGPIVRWYQINPSTEPSPFAGIEWSIQADGLSNDPRPDGQPYIGYGQVRFQLEFRWRYTIDSTLPFDVSVTGSLGVGQPSLAPNTWSSWGSVGTRGGLSLLFEYQTTSQANIMGSAEVEVRVASNTSLTLTPLLLPFNLMIGQAIRI